jgi:hypothetical protein
LSSMDGRPPTENQVSYVRGIQRRLHLPDRMLDDYCTTRFQAPFAQLDRAQVSALLDEMIAWQELPASMARAAGQRDLPGLER